MLVLKKSFKDFRFTCEFRKYYQKYSNEEYFCRGREFGKWGVDYGHIKCTHPESFAKFCRENHKEEDCPQVMKDTKEVV